MYRIVVGLLAVGSVAAAGSDPDARRSMTEGQERYVPGKANVGTVYEAFAIRFPGRTEVFISPSRFDVQYGDSALNCRNQSAYPIGDDAVNVWHKVSFSVLSLKESAVESPAGSGNWTWKTSFDCEIRSLMPVG